MKATEHQQDADQETEDMSQDPLWDLLRQSPSVPVSSGFADRVVLAARRADAEVLPFWTRGRAVLASAAAAAAALVTAAVLVSLPDPAPTLVQHTPDQADAFAPLDEVASQEMLLAATDHLGEFSDTELVTLIGF